MFKSLFKDAGLYLISNVVNRALPFLLLPVLTHYLTPAEYGIFIMYQVIMNFILPIIAINSESAASRIVYILSEEDAKIYVANSILPSIGITVILTLFYFPLGNLVASFLEFPSFWLVIIILVTFGETLKNVHLSLWQAKKQAKRYAVYSIAQAIFRFFASLIPIYLFQDKLVALLWGYSLSLGIFSVYSAYFLSKSGYLFHSFHRKHFISFLKYGLPLIPHKIGSWFMGMSDRVIITRKVSIADMGIYSVGYSIGMGVGLIQDGFNRAWVPFFYEQMQKNDHQANLKIVRFIYVYAVAMIIFAIIVMVLAPFIFPFLGAKFASAEVFVAWIAFAFAFNGIYKMFTNFLFFSERTYFLGYITLSTGLLNGLLSYTLVSFHGVIGAAYSAVIIQCIMCLVVFLTSRKIFPMPWREGLLTLRKLIK